MQRRQRHLGGADQEELVAGDLVDHLPLAREEAGPVQRPLADQDRRHDRDRSPRPAGRRGRTGSAPARPSPGRRADRRSASPRPAPPSPSRSSRSPMPRSRWSRGSNSNSGRSPTSRSVTASSSASPSGASGSGRLGSVASELVALRLDLGELGLELLELGAHLAHLGDQPAQRPRRRAWPRRSVGGPVLRGAALLDLGQQLPAAARRARAARRAPRRRRGAPAPPLRGPGPRGCCRRSSTSALSADGFTVADRLRVAVGSPTGTRAGRLDGRLGGGARVLGDELGDLEASLPVTMFWGMIAPEKPPLRIAKMTSW